MADRRGRCANVTCCVVAVSQHTLVVPDGKEFACTRCGEPLQPLPPRTRRRTATSLIVQGAVMSLGAAALTARLIGVIGGTMVADTAAVSANAAALRPALPSGVPGRAVLLRLAGSDIIGARLAPRLASNYLGQIGSTDIAVLPGGADGVMEVTGQQATQRDAVTITLNSAAAGFNMLLRRTADVAMSATRISAEDAQRLAPLGDMTSPAAEAAIAIQGIAVAVSPGNPARSLTLQQLRGVFSGRITSWAELGAAALPVHLYVAQGRGGAAIVPQEVGVGQDGITATASWVPAEGLAAALAADPGGIGLLPFGSTGATKLLAVGDDAPPVAPDRATITGGSYPLVRTLYFYTAPMAGSPLARRFTDYVFTPAGQAAVEAAGFMPLPPRQAAPATPEASPDRPRTALTGATRLTMEFHVQPNGRDLDRNGVRDLDRLAAHLKAGRINPSRLVLAGVTDPGAISPASHAAAQARAEAVAAALTRAGMAPGRTLALATDVAGGDAAASDARDRTRRVEVYVTPP